MQDLTNIKMHHATRKAAVKLNDMLEAEYPALSLEAIVDEDEEGTETLTGWAVNANGETFFKSDSTPKLADILEACGEADIDPTEGEKEEEEDKPSASIVPEQYRARYREVSSTQRSCGDWLAEWLATETLNADLDFDAAAFHAILVSNGVDLTTPWARLYESGQRGWRGRFRMNGRQALEKAIAFNGAVRNWGGAVVEIPAAELEALQSRHAKWLMKSRKQAAAAEAVAGQPEAA